MFTSFGWIRGIVSLTKNGGANPYHGTAAGDGIQVVPGHTHGQAVHHDIIVYFVLDVNT